MKYLLILLLVLATARGLQAQVGYSYKKALDIVTEQSGFEFDENTYYDEDPYRSDIVTELSIEVRDNQIWKFYFKDSICIGYVKMHPMSGISEAYSDLRKDHSWDEKNKVYWTFENIFKIQGDKMFGWYHKIIKYKKWYTITVGPYLLGEGKIVPYDEY